MVVEPRQEALNRPARGAMPDSNLRARLRLRPLMHDLIDFGLVERTAPGVWALKGDVQSLLEVEYGLDGDNRDDHVFIGLRCEHCGERTITSLFEGQRLCSSCQGESRHVGP
ncbi:MAG TPA: hypothetical protein VHZ02_08905 [Acidimicrobiales bacterium]|jgi:hypothetical protein|nr:hypothetical protein [Acidimicrobiales bacterium]